MNLLKKVMIAIEIHDEDLFSHIHQQSTYFNSTKTEINWVEQLEYLFDQDNVFEPESSRGNSFVMNSRIF